MAIRKLTDAQVKTFVHIATYTPEMPTSFNRFPTLQMMLDAGIILRQGNLLVVNPAAEENAYRYVVPANFVADSGDARSFKELEKAGMLTFNPSAEPRETTETDEEYRNRLVAELPEGAVNSAEEIGDASGVELDAVGTYLRCHRLIPDTFHYYDTVVLVGELEKLGCVVDIGENQLVIPAGNDAVAEQAKVLVDAFERKYAPAATEAEVLTDREEAEKNTSAAFVPKPDPNAN